MGVSMEEFGPISVDYFNQRRVEKVTEDEDGAVWTIYFEGSGVLHNYDPKIPAPKAIVGAALTMTILGGHTDPETRTPLTRLMFGMEEVKLNPLEYAISDPNFTKGQLVFAQRSSANMPSVPPHPDERAAEGPEEQDADHDED